MAEELPRTRRWTTWLWAAVAVALLALVIWQLRWFDQAYLLGAEASRPVRVLAQEEDRLVVLTAEGRQVLPKERFEPSPVGDEPRIDCGLHSVLVHLRWQWALLAVLAFGPAPLLAALRWHGLLAVAGIHLTRWQAVKLTYAGSFFNLVSLGMTGGDLVKAYYLTQHTTRRAEGVTIVLFDRVIGMLGLVVLGVVAAGFQWQNPLVARAAWIIVILLAGLVAGFGVFFSRRARRFLRFDWLITRLPFGQIIRRMDQAVFIFRYRRRTLALALLVTVAIHAFAQTGVALLGKGMQVPAPMGVYYLYIPLGFLLGSVSPIFQGLGVMEGVFYVFFCQQGLASPAQAVMLAMGYRLLMLLWALPGSLVPLTGAYLPDRQTLKRAVETTPDSPGAPLRP